MKNGYLQTILKHFRGFAPILLVITACGSELNFTAGDAATGADGTNQPGTYGERCASNEECATGLCLFEDSDLAPLGWCTKACDVEKEPCGEQDATGQFPSYCVKMPSEYKGELKQLCLPLCTEIYDCQGLADFWETCDIPAYKGNPIYGTALPVKVCQAPSAHGKSHVDPTTCSGWEAAYGDGLEGEVNICKAYCEYLVACSEVAEPNNYNQDCCGFGCLLEMAPEGQAIPKFQKQKQCYVQNFFSWQGTPQVCEKPVEECGGKPPDPRPGE